MGELINKQPHAETMAERWQRVKPADFANATDFCLRLGRIDTQCTFKLFDDGVGIYFSDGSPYRMPKRETLIG